MNFAEEYSADKRASGDDERAICDSSKRPRTCVSVSGRGYIQGLDLRNMECSENRSIYAVIMQICVFAVIYISIEAARARAHRADKLPMPVVERKSVHVTYVMF